MNPLKVLKLRERDGFSCSIQRIKSFPGHITYILVLLGFIIENRLN